MQKNTLLAFVALFLALPLSADISLKNVVLPDAFLVVHGDEAKLRGSLLGVKSEEFANLNGNMNDLMQIQRIADIMLPEEAQRAGKGMIVIGGDMRVLTDGLTQAESLEESESTDALKKIKLIAGITYPVPIKEFFGVLNMAPLLNPQLGNAVSLTPIQVEGYSGYRISDKNDQENVFDTVISEDGMTILIGMPDVLKEQIAAPKEFPPEIQALVNASAQEGGAFILAIDKSLKKELKEEIVDESSFDATVKEALSGMQGISLSWSSTPTDVTMTLTSAFADEEAAKAIKTILLDAEAVPMGRQMLPILLGPEYSFPKSIASFQKEAMAGLQVTFSENDCNAICEYLPLLAAAQGLVGDEDDFEIIGEDEFEEFELEEEEEFEEIEEEDLNP